MNQAANIYDIVAPEYYNTQRHPTCANFRTASRRLIFSWLDLFKDGEVLEVGCGRSLAAPWMNANHRPLSRLTLTDGSPEMLVHSQTWEEKGARLMARSAFDLNLPRQFADLVVSSLGDPYNGQDFWDEVRKVIKPGGLFIFTTPSAHWAQTFRENGEAEQKTSSFVLADGGAANLPSHIYDEDRQRELFERAGFEVLAVDHVCLSDLNNEPISPKLLVGDPHRLAIVTGYLCRAK